MRIITVELIVPLVGRVKDTPLTVMTNHWFATHCPRQSKFYYALEVFSYKGKPDRYKNKQTEKRKKKGAEIKKER